VVDLVCVSRITRLHANKQPEAVRRRIHRVSLDGVLEVLQHLSWSRAEPPGAYLDTTFRETVGLLKGKGKWILLYRERGGSDLLRRLVIIRLQQIRRLHPHDIRIRVDDLCVLPAGLFSRVNQVSVRNMTRPSERTGESLQASRTKTKEEQEQNERQKSRHQLTTTEPCAKPALHLPPENEIQLRSPPDGT
jgi:hypothetical protein